MEEAYHKLKSKDKITITAKNKALIFQEKKVLEKIYKGNSKKEDYDLMNNIIDKRLIIQTLIEKIRNYCNYDCL